MKGANNCVQLQHLWALSAARVSWLDSRVTRVIFGWITGSH